MSSTDFSQFPRAGFLRRLGSFVYDFLLSAAVYMVAGASSFLIFGMLVYFGVISMGEHQHLIDLQQSSIAYQLAIYGWNMFWVCQFFVYFWCRNGQTLGMRAWRLRVQNTDGSIISKLTAWKRLATGMLGLGNLIVLVNFKNKQSLQDIATNTEVVVLSLEVNKGKGWHN